MTKKFHYNQSTGKTGLCNAEKQSCPLGDNIPHFETEKQAMQHAEKEAAKENEIFTNITKDKNSNEKLLEILPKIHSNIIEDKNDAFYVVNDDRDEKAINNFANYHLFKTLPKVDRGNTDNYELAMIISKRKFLKTKMGEHYNGFEYDPMEIAEHYSDDDIDKIELNMPNADYKNRPEETFKNSNELRVNKKTVDDYMYYNEETKQYINNLTAGEHNALAYWSSCGSSITGHLLNSGKDNTYNLQNNNPDDKETYFNTQNYLSIIDDAIDKAPINKEPKILYRGLNNSIIERITNNSNDVTESIKHNFTPGKEIEFDMPQSTSHNPTDAMRFSSNHNVIFEVKARKSAPIGAMSSWGYAEMEYLIPRNSKYKVIEVQENVSYENRRGNTRAMTVIQLEQL